MTMHHRVIYGQITLRNLTTDTKTYGYKQTLGF